MKKLFSILLCGALIFGPCLGAFALSPAPTVKSETAVLIDATTGQVLYDKNMNTKMYPASTTKVMTGLLAAKNGTLTDVITMTNEDVFSIGRGTSHIALAPDEQLTLEQALYAVSIESANDAANGVATLLGGSLEGFANMMNEEVKRLGLQNTHFVNAHGLHDPDHYTTAYDLALIAAEAIKYDTFNKIFSVETYTIPPTNKKNETRVFHSQNWFLNGALKYDGLIMSKTGWTGEAGHTMVTAAKRGDVSLIAVVMKSTSKADKWDDTTALLDWGFSQFKAAPLSGQYIALSAPEEILCDEEGKLVIRRQDISAPDYSVLLYDDLCANDVQVDFENPVLSEDLTSATLDATMYLMRDGGSRYDLGSTKVSAVVSERKAASLSHDIPQNKFGDLVTVIIFTFLSFIGVMIADVLINKRIL